MRHVHDFFFAIIKYKARYRHGAEHGQSIFTPNEGFLNKIFN